MKTITAREFFTLKAGSPEAYAVISDVDKIHFRIRSDYYRRNDNVKAGKKLCLRCDGTGNEFFSCYHKCPTCNGKGAQ
jgi:uncharacterized OB-fold protein